uniref:CCAAT enhancer binding protein zeta n=1 Tax=Myotis myotis TaxID=51298 RepID=A0A7J7U4D9_MYOMY|nr:CCAAT enhancer binding protein zeta [Myotis myotis]
MKNLLKLMKMEEHSWMCWMMRVRAVKTLMMKSAPKSILIKARGKVQMILTLLNHFKDPGKKRKETSVTPTYLYLLKSLATYWMKIWDPSLTTLA